MDFSPWERHFELNAGHSLEAQLDRAAPCRLNESDRQAFVRSLQRFELGERGDGAHLLAAAERAGDATYTRALALLVIEEQRHSSLFGQALRHLGGEPLAGHWSDTAFTMLRRALGLRTELGLFLVAESVALEYFGALATAAPDPVLRAIGARVCRDELNHLRFQVARLAQAFTGTPAPIRWAARIALLTIGTCAAMVVAFDHRAALRACDRQPIRYACRALRHLRRHLDLALAGSPCPLGPVDQLLVTAC